MPFWFLVGLAVYSLGFLAWGFANDLVIRDLPLFVAIMYIWWIVWLLMGVMILLEKLGLIDHPAIKEGER